MHPLIHVYDENATFIEQFIVNTLKQINFNAPINTARLFELFPSLELYYACDVELNQVSENIYRDRVDARPMGENRAYLAPNIDAPHTFTAPYISTATSRFCITMMIRTDAGFIFLDFGLRKLLERFNLIVERNGFNRLNRYAYMLLGGGLIFFGLFVTLYGFFTFGQYLFDSVPLSLDTIFKPVIALTLGMAVYDLGKTLVEQEVLPKTEHVSKSFKAKTLINFLVSIIIAMMIEALLVIFKISLDDYTKLPYGASLIVALALLLYVFGKFTKNVQSQN
ncbi:MAG: hypothetical protein KU37_08545 [Sulfuricurvum sp. PC08-66]|nr:MAG: hypothetical protein KU37_08545 [Sulfuricurvum sp. PC08-66]